MCINHIHNIQITQKIHYKIYDMFYSLNCHQNLPADIAAIFIGTLHSYRCILVMITSPWRREQQRPKHVGGSLVNKMYVEHWSKFCWSLLYYGINISLIKTMAEWLQNQNNICTLRSWMLQNNLSWDETCRFLDI